MTRDAALIAAREEARKHRLAMIVCNDPIGNAEEDAEGEGPWGYCPRSAADLLFRYRITAENVYIDADGFEYTEAELREWGKAAGCNGMFN